MRNLLTVELEEYFHDEGFADAGDRRAWDGRRSHVRRQTMDLLDLLDARRRRATFFVLGWSAERDPALVREVAARGHEIASHGMGHAMPETQTVRSFRSDVRDARRLLEDVVGAPVAGYRAPGFAVTCRTPWAHRVLAEEGYAYSSSVCPTRLDAGDCPARPTPWEAPCGRGRRILEIPPLSHRVCGQNVPIAGGAYLRLLPARVVSNAIAAFNAAGAPGVLTIRPWEIDATRAGTDETPRSQWRHWVGVAEFPDKLTTLLREHSFGPVRDWLARPRDGSPLRAVPRPAQRAAV